MSIPILATLASIAISPAAAYFILNHGPLESTRLDPIISPGTVSGHVHAIVGGSNFQATMDYATTQASTCTTAPVTVDKSSYWTPQLYSYSNNAFTLIPNTGANTYYLGRTDAAPKAFPQGHRMVSGNPYRRTFNESSYDDQAISFVCLTSGSHSGDARYDQRNSFFDVQCDTMRMQVNFPTCSDGRLDSDDHKSHMTWPSNGLNGGVCPDSHPIALVQLFYEFFYDLSKFPYVQGATNYVLANGDTTGYGFHGDFIAGWDVDVLQDAVTNCNQNNGVGGVLTNCPAFVPYLDSDAARACGGQNDVVDEDIGDTHSLTALPGNNPLGGLAAGSTTGTTAPSPGYKSTGSTLPAGWTRAGCIAEGTSGRALTGATYTSTTEMTQAACATFCASKGFNIAGVEYAQECYCDSQMRNGASSTTLLATDQCGLKCTGLSTEKCGGYSTLSLLTSSGVAATTTDTAAVTATATDGAGVAATTSAAVVLSAVPSGWTYSGCKSEGQNRRTLSAYSFTSDNDMTIEDCLSQCGNKGFAIAGLEWARECYCDNAYGDTGGVTEPESDCNMACTGSSIEMCGGSDRLSTYTKSTTTKRRLGSVY